MDGPLRGEYERWLALPFPLGGLTEELSAIKADLAFIDTWIAEAVIPFVRRGEYTEDRIDVLAELRALRSRALRLPSEPDSNGRVPSLEYQAYIDQLAAVYTALIDEAGSRAGDDVS